MATYSWAIFGSLVRNPGHALAERAVNYFRNDAAEHVRKFGCIRALAPSHAIDNGAPITLVSATLGPADLKTMSVYAHA